MNWEKLIAENFDPGAVSRGRDYWKNGRVRSVKWQTGGDGPTLISTVRGSSGNYDQVTHVDLDLENIDGDCTCPVSYNCKHVVAALLAANPESIESEAGDFAHSPAKSGELFAFTGDLEPANAALPSRDCQGSVAGDGEWKHRGERQCER